VTNSGGAITQIGVTAAHDEHDQGWARILWTWRAPAVLFAVGLLLASVGLLWSWLVAPTAHPGWFVQNDLIKSSENAWWQGRTGGLTHLYSGNGALLEGLPGYQLWLVAVVLLGQHVGMPIPGEASSSHVVFGAVHPVGSIWYLVVPLALGAAFAALFPFDALVRRIGIRGAPRIVTLSVLTVLIGWSAAFWGHPEYAVASGFLAGALLSAGSGQWRRAGWLLGFGIACQPVVLLTVPLLLLLARRDWLRTFVRACVPPLVVVFLPLVGDPGDTLRAIFVATEDPRYGHHTPLLAVVPHPHLLAVSAGWPRTSALLVALGLAIPLARWVRSRVDLQALVWATAAVLALRAVSEALFFPYYLTPFLVVALSIAFGHRWARALGAVFWAAGLIVLVSSHVLGLWAYWSVLVAGEAGLLALTLPLPRADDRPGHPRTVPTTGVLTRASTDDPNHATPPRLGTPPPEAVSR